MEKIIPKDLNGEELKVGDEVVFSKCTSTSNSMLCKGYISNIEYKPKCTWIFINFEENWKRGNKTHQFKGTYKYIYTKDRIYCNICKTHFTLIFKDIQNGHPDPPGNFGEDATKYIV